MDLKVAAIIMVCFFIVMDIVTGYLAAMKTGSVNSSVIHEGLWHKIGEIFAIISVQACEICMNLFGNELMHTDLTIPLTTGLCFGLILYEITSIFENIGIMNPTVGKWLVKHIGIEPYKVGIDFTDEDNIK